MTNFITGDDKANRLAGGSGADQIQGGTGDDILNGGGGDDVIFDSYPHNYFDGTYNDPGPDSDKLYGGEGNDFLIHYQGIARDSGNVQLQDADMLDGGNGDDVLSFNGTQVGGVTLGGEGTDTLSVEYLHEATTSYRMVLSGTNANVSYLLGDGPQTVVTGTSIERASFTSSAGNDTLIGGALDDRLGSYGGQDNLSGGGGNDEIEINLIDVYAVQPTVTLDGGADTDLLRYDSYLYSAQDFVFDLPGGKFTADGKSLGAISGFEQLQVWTRDGDDTLIGGAFGDNLRADEGSNTLKGNGGNDSLSSGGGVDQLDGGEGNDSLSAGGNKDTLIGGAGDDTLNGGDGADSMYGGSGNDTYVVDDFYAAGPDHDVIVDVGGVDRILTTASTVDLRLFEDVENVSITFGVLTTVTGNDRDNIIDGDSTKLTADGGKGNDTIIASEFGGALSGGVGNDVLKTGKYADTLDGGDGNDELTGMDGDDTASGGAGDDLIYGDLKPVPNGAVPGSGKLTKSAGKGTEQNPLILDKHFSLKEDADIERSTVAPHVTVAAKHDLAGDFYQVSLKAGLEVIVDVDTDDSYGIDSDIVLLNAKGQQVAEISYGSPDREKSGGSPNGNDPFLTYVADKTGVYTIAIKSTSSQTDKMAYRLNVSLGELGGGDVLSGGAGKDKLYGGQGDDVLDGGSGDDRLDGGKGNDAVSYASVKHAVTISLDKSGSQSVDGKDTLISIEGVVGSKFDDKLTGDEKDNLLQGGKGNDRLDGGKGSDTAIYSEAKTSVSVSLSKLGAQSTGGGGNDTLISVEGLIGSDGNDRLTGNGQNNTLSGGKGDDRLQGGQGNDRLDGGIGVDTVSYADAGKAVKVDLALSGRQDTGGSGKDALFGIENIVGGAGADKLYGSALGNILDGGKGDDRVYGRAGDDWLKGSSGNDMLDGGDGRDTADYSASTKAIKLDLTKTAAQNTEGSGTDILKNIEDVIGGSGSDRLFGNAKANHLTGGKGNDSLSGSGGDDWLIGGKGNDKYDGGSGKDTADFSGEGSSVKVDLSKASSQSTNSGSDSFKSIEVLIGSSQSDTLTGGKSAETLIGGSGNDKLSGGDGDDFLQGGKGEDTLVGGKGSHDTASYVDAVGTAITVLLISGVTVDLSNTKAQDTVGAGKDKLSGIEDVVGSKFRDKITGDAHANHLNGGAGGDVLTGGGGDDVLDGGRVDFTVFNSFDTLDGGAGRDTATYAAETNAVTVDLTQAYTGTEDKLISIEEVVGSAFADTLLGGAGGDTLRGGDGDDTLAGRGGADNLFGSGGKDTFLFTAGALDGTADTVNGFKHTVDTIKLDYTVFTAPSYGSLADTAFGEGTTAKSAGEHILYDTQSGVLRYDADGKGGADAVEFAIVTGAPDLSAFDFLIG